LSPGVFMLKATKLTVLERWAFFAYNGGALSITSIRKIERSLIC
jgi:hypothetical protein